MNGQNSGILAVLFFPLIGGVLSFCIGKSNKEFRNHFINVVMLVEMAVIGYMAYLVCYEGRVMSTTLMSVGKLQIHFLLDRMHVLLCGLLTVVFVIMFWFLKESLWREERSNRFYLIYTVVYVMLLGAFMTDSLFNYSLFTVLTFLFIYPLIVHRQDENALKNARIYLIFLTAAIVFLMAGCTLLLVKFGDTDYGVLYYAAMADGYHGITLLAGIFVMAGFAICTGLFPVQMMITRGSSYGLMEASAILAGVASKLGVIGLMTLAANMFPNEILYGRIVLVLALLTIIWGLLLTFAFTDIRKIIMGLNIATNGFNTLAVSLMVLCGDSNGYASRSSVYMLFASSLSLLALYMVALEQVRKMHTFEIKGLIASGKENKCMAAVCFLACASMAGVPGTAGFLSHALLYRTILVNLHWRWLVVLYIILWAFLATAVTRIFMKLFVSTREKALRIMTEEGEAVNMQKEAYEEKLIEEDKTKKNSYRVGEILLLMLGCMQIIVGILPHQFFDKMAGAIVEYSNGEKLFDMIPYYTSDIVVAVVIVTVLTVLLYVNLIHGILLRRVKDKKNRELQEK